jgi:hypothetical protein
VKGEKIGFNYILKEKGEPACLSEDKYRFCNIDN